jgi:signal transduction histidine kinase
LLPYSHWGADKLDRRLFHPDQFSPADPMSEPTPRKRIQAVLQGVDVIYLSGFLLILISLVLNIVDRPSGALPGRFAAGLVCIGMVLLLHTLRPWIASSSSQPDRVNIAVLILIALFILGSTWFSPSITGDAYLLLIIVGMAFQLLAGPAAAVLTAASVALWLLIPYSYYGVDILFGLSLSITFGLIFFIAIGWLVRRNTLQLTQAEKLTIELQQANEELRISRLKEKDLAVVEERIRLARDIHDGLGHHLTVLNVQLQAAEIQLENEPAAAAEAIRICRQEAQLALEEVRRSVAVMRSSPLNGMSLEEALERMIQEFARHTSLEARFEVAGEPHPLEAPAAMTCFRAVQEGLTNVQKHARAPQQVWIQLEYSPLDVKVLVKDDGLASPKGEAGYGLAGLQERALQLGGQFRAEAIPSGGYALELRLLTGDEND